MRILKPFQNDEEEDLENLLSTEVTDEPITPTPLPPQSQLSAIKNPTNSKVKTSDIEPQQHYQNQTSFFEIQNKKQSVNDSIPEISDQHQHRNNNISSIERSPSEDIHDIAFHHNSVRSVISEITTISKDENSTVNLAENIKDDNDDDDDDDDDEVEENESPASIIATKNNHNEISEENFFENNSTPNISKSNDNLIEQQQQKEEVLSYNNNFDKNTETQSSTSILQGENKEVIESESTLEHSVGADEGEEANAEYDTLVSVTIDSNPSKSKSFETKSNSKDEGEGDKDGVVFMGWKNSNTTTTSSSSSHQSPPNMKKINKMKKALSAPERQKKNIWKGMLSSNAAARWTSPIKKKINNIGGGSNSNNNTSSGGGGSNRGRSFSSNGGGIRGRSFSSNGGGSIGGSANHHEQEKQDEDTQSEHPKTSPMNEDKSAQKEMPQIVDEQNQQQTSENPTKGMDTMNETTIDYSTPRKSNKSPPRKKLNEGGKEDQFFLRINTQHFNDPSLQPMSPPSLKSNKPNMDGDAGGVNEEQDDESKSDGNMDPTNIVGVVSATPTRKNRKKPFGRKNMKIKSKSLKPSGGGGGGDQSNIMSDDVTMQKEFVQIKPFNRYLEGFQMSATELYQEMMRKSNHVEMMKSTQLANRKEGNNEPIGSLKVELLSCMGLPQIRRSKPNSMAYIVCGDAAFSTDVIQSSLSPMWPARSRRAACFPIFHAYARLYTGIFGVTDKDNDDFIGRSVIDIATLRPNTDYDVALPLRSSGTVYDPEPRGVVRLRFHLTYSKPNAAILSYLPSKMNEVFVDRDEPADLVTIPCAEPKSMRNVAFTVHGEDLPGKYSKKAFRAINRELNLYQFQTPMAFKRTLVHLMTYEKPFASTYIFLGWMTLLHYHMYHLVPSYIVSLAIVVHVVNYFDLTSNNNKMYTGFEPLTVSEIFDCFIHGNLPSLMRNEKPAHSQCYDLESYMKVMGDIEVPSEDSLAFPFSESKYAKPTLKSMFCPKVTSHKKRHGDGPGSRISRELEDASSRDSGDSDDNDSMSDVKVEEEIVENANVNRMNPTGPEQDDHIETRENTFQENLKSIENVLHSLTGDYFHEQVSRSIQHSKVDIDNTDQGIPGVQANKFTNPLAVLTGTFLEPIMHVINVYILAVRTVFNITHWKDPYLSFLFLVLLIILMFILALFPWRSFFMLSGIVLFGPQNYILKDFIEKLFGEDDFDEQYIEDDTHRGKKKRQEKVKPRKDGNGTEVTFDRPLFSSQHGMRQFKKKNVTPLEIVVPYARAKKERFFFWPPYSLLSTSFDSSHEIDMENLSVNKKTQ